MNKTHKNKWRLLEILVHILIWTVIPIRSIIIHKNSFFIGLTNASDGSIYYALVFGWIFNATLFYGTAFWLMPKFLAKEKYLKFIFWLLVLFFGISGIEYIQEALVIRFYELTPAVFDGLNQILTLGETLLGTNLVVVLFAFLYRFSRDWLRTEIKNKRLIKEKHLTELNFLRSQVNPHFLFNTLNNLYGMALTQNVPVIAEKINKLSGIMRYMLYESNADKVLLENEIHYIKDFIDIQKLRFSDEDPITITLNIKGEFGTKKIPPMLLIPFIENAFKHGVDIKKKSLIKIKIELQKTMLNLEVINSNHKMNHMKRKDENGIGLENVKMRLNLLFPETHKLLINDENDYFKVYLKFPL